MDEKEAGKKSSLRNEKLRANRASETEEQREKRLRIGREKDKSKKDNPKITRGKEKVVRHRRPRETMPGHSQKIEAR